MSLSLTYRPDSPLTAEEKAVVLADAGALESSRRWWSEPLCFMEIPGMGFVGMTKLFLLGASSADGTAIQVHETENFLMAWNEIRVISDILAGWAKRFGVGWALGIDDDPLGAITPEGEPSEELRASLAGLLAMSGATETGPDLERRIREIDAKYAAR